MVAVLTKADALKLPAVNQLMKEEGLAMEEVMPRVEEYRLQLLDELRKKIESQLNGRKYPPKVYLSMASKLVEDDIGCLF